MPKIKQPNPHPLTELLKSKDIRGPQISKILDLCPYTSRQRLENPLLFTVGDIRKIVKSGKLPIEKVRECVSKELSWTKF